MANERIIDAQKALEMLKSSVERRGAEYVHTSGCSYANIVRHNGYEVEKVVAGCLVGDAVINELHIDPLEFMEETDVRTGQYLRKMGDGNGKLAFANESGVYDLAEGLKELGYVLTDFAIEVFEVAQETQDNGNTWGEALAKASHLAKVEE